MVPSDIQKSQGTKRGSAAFPGELRGSATVPAASSPKAAFPSRPDTLCSGVWSLCFSESFGLAFENRAEAGGRGGSLQEK